MTTTEWPKSRGLEKCCDKERKHQHTEECDRSKEEQGLARVDAWKWSLIYLLTYFEVNIVVILIKLPSILKGHGFWLETKMQRGMEPISYNPFIIHDVPYQSSLPPPKERNASRVVWAIGRGLLGPWGEITQINPREHTCKPRLDGEDFTIQATAGTFFQVCELSPISNIILH